MRSTYHRGTRPFTVYKIEQSAPPFMVITNDEQKKIKKSRTSLNSPWEGCESYGQGEQDKSHRAMAFKTEPVHGTNPRTRDIKMIYELHGTRGVQIQLRICGTKERTIRKHVVCNDKWMNPTANYTRLSNIDQLSWAFLRHAGASSLQA